MIGKLHTIVVDTPDVSGLSSFYTELAGWKQLSGDSGWATVEADDGTRLGFQHAPDLVPPLWPDPAAPQQAHLDLRVPDLAAGAARAVELGASVLRENESWWTLADPSGHPFDLCVKEDNPGTTLFGLTVDCPDAGALAAFYAELLGKPVTYDQDGMAMIGEEGRQPVLFQQVDDYRAPRWPDPTHPQQLHLDVEVTDVEEGERAVLALGAVRLPGQGQNFRVYADPARKPFCLVWD